MTSKRKSSGNRATATGAATATSAGGGGGVVNPVAGPIKPSLTVTNLSSGNINTSEYVSLINFSDSTTSNVETTQVFGRADPIKIFGSSSRKVSFSIVLQASVGFPLISFLHTTLYRGLDSQGVASQPPLISLQFIGGGGTPSKHKYVGYLNECSTGDAEGLITSKAGVADRGILEREGILTYQKLIVKVSLDVIHTHYPGEQDGAPPVINIWGNPNPTTTPTDIQAITVPPGSGETR